jgi:hypothetical protein
MDFRDALKKAIPEAEFKEDERKSPKIGDRVRLKKNGLGLGVLEGIRDDGRLLVSGLHNSSFKRPGQELRMKHYTINGAEIDK